MASKLELFGKKRGNIRGAPFVSRKDGQFTETIAVVCGPAGIRRVRGGWDEETWVESAGRTSNCGADWRDFVPGADFAGGWCDGAGEGQEWRECDSDE